MDTKRQEAYELAWNHAYPEAINRFQAILKNNPDDIDARLGLTYTFAWSAAYSQAIRNFRRVLSQVPDHPEALKGMAYTAFWSGQFQQALGAFEQLPLELKQSDEIIQTRGFIYLSLGKIPIARMELEKLTSPKRKQELSRAIQAAQSKWEAWIWGGLSHIDAKQNLGIRAAQVTWSANTNLQIWMRMDNSLTMDNSSLVLRDTSATAYWLGTKFSLAKKWQTQLELGQRTLPNALSQRLLQLEQVFFFSPGKSLKAGSFLGFGSGLPTDLLLYLGLNQEIYPRIWAEQNVYAAWTGKRFDQYRVALSAKYQTKKSIEYLLGIQGGEQFVVGEQFDTQVWGLWDKSRPLYYKNIGYFSLPEKKEPPSTPF